MITPTTNRSDALVFLAACAGGVYAGKRTYDHQKDLRERTQNMPNIIAAANRGKDTEGQSFQIPKPTWIEMHPKISLVIGSLGGYTAGFTTGHGALLVTSLVAGKILGSKS